MSGYAKNMPDSGIEPLTFALRVQRSTPKLNRRNQLINL